MSEPIIACDLTAIHADARDEHLKTIRQVLQAVEEVRDLDTGYALRLPLENTLLMQAAAFISNERLCCPFFGFTLDIEPGSSMFWLRLTGGEGVKASFMAGMGNHLPEGVRQAMQPA